MDFSLLFAYRHYSICKNVFQYAFIQKFYPNLISIKKQQGVNILLYDLIGGGGVRLYGHCRQYVEKEKGSKYICYITEYGTYKERITLKKLSEELISDEFILVERGYIINVTHIASMTIIKYQLSILIFFLLRVVPAE